MVCCSAESRMKTTLLSCEQHALLYESHQAELISKLAKAKAKTNVEASVAVKTKAKTKAKAKK